MHVMKHVNTEYQNEKLSLSENKMIILEYLILSMHMKTWTAVLKNQFALCSSNRLKVFI